MLCYNYDPDSKRYAGMKEIKIAANGDALIPANSTLVAPPELAGPWTWDASIEEWIGATIEEAKAAKLAAIQAEKTKARDGGFMVNGTLFDSDEAARVAYLELAMKLQADPEFSTAWKASDGAWVTMNAELFSQVYAAGANHIAACFAWQGAREAEVAAAESVEAVELVSERYS